MTQVVSEQRVAVLRCGDYQPQRVRAVLEKHFELLGGMGKFVKRGQSILIKPNLIAPKPREQAVVTDPVVITELAAILKDFGARPFVGDSTAWGDTSGVARVLELEEPLRRLGVTIRDLDSPRGVYIERAGAKVGISRWALEAEAIINVPKLKAHQQLGATIAVKNMFGCVCGKSKALWHFRRGKDEAAFCGLLLGVYEQLRPVLTIVDAVIAMEGPGPINGTPRALGAIVSGEEALSIEAVCAELISFSHNDLVLLRNAAKLGITVPQVSEITIVGDGLEGLKCSDFRQCEAVPILFSFPRVCKSIARQFVKKILNAI